MQKLNAGAVTKKVVTKKVVMEKVVLKMLAVLLVTGTAYAAPRAKIKAAKVKKAQTAAQNLSVQPLPPGISEAEVRAHVIAPANVENIESEAKNEARFKMKASTRTSTTKSFLIISEFGAAIHGALKDSTNGYMMQLRKNGVLVQTLQWNWAKGPKDGGIGWNPQTRMHAASVSKFLTALGMVKTLDAKGISYDAKIAPYLPAYWTKGTNIDKITFRHLMTHTSGFSTDSSSSDYNFMKSRVAAGVFMKSDAPEGVSGVGGKDYENMNFGLCRILIPIINGNIDKNTKYADDTDDNDQAWDVITVTYFRNYLQANVFTPSGVANVGFKPTASPARALAYEYKGSTAKGWDSGDLSSVAGGAAWRLSVSELLNVMDNARRRNTILPAAKTQYMLDNNFGIDQIIDTPAGKTYNKNGRWNSNGRTEQCVAFFMPQNIEVVVYVNSKIGSGDGFNLRSIVQDAYENSLSG